MPNDPKSMYRFKVGNVYVLNVPVFDENKNFHDKGTKVRIVAIAPKVYIVKGLNNDTHKYFYNAVVASQDPALDFKNRIRENFCTLTLNNKKESK